jgi:formylglycine-generating enzyme required for sulfatase activity
MMRDKVTNAQFAAAWQSRDKPDERLRELMLKHTAQNRYPQAVPGNWKDLGLQPKYGPLPVMNVTVTEAHCFAEWLGGVLPSGEQWDEAGGKAAALDGPLPSSASPVGRLGILPWTRDAHRLGPAVGVVAYVDELPFVGPLPAGTCPADTARSGCRDLAGNGKEFTRDVTVAVGVLNPPPVPLPVPDAGAMVALRGRTFLAYKPFRFRDADPKYPDAMWYNGSDPDLGFRVVVPIPDPSPATGNGPAGR